MKKKRHIGIVGLGVVGAACKFGFEKLGHAVKVHDLKLRTSITNVMDTDVTFICVPTPSNELGACDTAIVEGVVQSLLTLRYEGVIAVKSTVTPGTTSRMRLTHQTSSIVFVPEFLRERCAISDFVENHSLLAVGCDDRFGVAPDAVYDLIVEVHGQYPKNVIRIGVGEAEMLKYFSNCFNALRVVFANEIYDTCNALGLSYDDVKDAYIKTGAVPDIYLDVNENFRGFAGACLPKDVKGLANLIHSLGLDRKLIETIDTENEKHKKTVFPGMRL